MEEKSDSEGNIRSCSDGAIHECSDCFPVWDILHASLFLEGFRALSFRIADGGVHGCRYWFQVCEVEALKNRVDIGSLRESESAFVEIAGDLDAEDPRGRSEIGHGVFGVDLPFGVVDELL